MSTLNPERRRRLTHRALPALALAALVGLAGGLITGSGRSEAEQTAERFIRAWAREDYAAMHRMLTPAARARVDRKALEDAYEHAAATATATRVELGELDGEEGERLRVPVEVQTRAFGPVSGHVLLPVVDGRIAWNASLVFPGLERGARLIRRTAVPDRGRILSRDGAVLAEGPPEARSSPLGDVAASIAGSVQPADDAASRAAVYSRGLPRSAPVGQDGLERVFDARLAGRPGGELLAGTRVLASSRPRPGRDVTTTIDIGLQEAAVQALGGRFGGIAVLDATNGRVRALAGIAFSAPQPPGSTFKLVTTTAALEAGLVQPTDEFPVETAATIDGVELENANGEACGGSFRNSFAHSCNSVFAPLGVEVGAKRLVDTAERYGFNRRPSLSGEVASTLPAPSEIVSPLELGATAIGQGRVLATPLQLASISQTVAADGVRTEPSLLSGARAPRARVTSRRVAGTITSLMVDVVDYGTGTSAAIPGVEVAGKTGTAELEDTRGPNAEASSDPSNTDAWFTAFAPAGRPRLAVGVLFVRAGSGGATAAPAAQAVLASALG